MAISWGGEFFAHKQTSHTIHPCGCDASPLLGIMCVRASAVQRPSEASAAFTQYYRQQFRHLLATEEWPAFFATLSRSLPVTVRLNQTAVSAIAVDHRLRQSSDAAARQAGDGPLCRGQLREGYSQSIRSQYWDGFSNLPSFFRTPEAYFFSLKNTSRSFLPFPFPPSPQKGIDIQKGFFFDF